MKEHIMNLPLTLAVVAIPVAGGIIGTRFWALKQQHNTIAARLARWSSQPHKQAPLTLLKKRTWSLDLKPGLNTIRQFLTESGLALGLNADGADHLTGFLALELSLLILPVVAAFALDLNLFLSAILALVLSAVPFIVLKIKADSVRAKFSEQLPDAIDLMVAVLRSGHSVSQSVKAVSEESPAPCGNEFETILHKMNLGQPLSQSLISSAQRFRSYELDLIRRAVSIQAEVGGSLAELLEKTNDTLRQRLKLARQLKVITAQSRLSAQIVGLLPIILAIGLNIMSPGYLQLLVEDSTGRMLLIVAIALELFGIYLMRRMSTMKIEGN